MVTLARTLGLRFAAPAALAIGLQFSAAPVFATDVKFDEFEIYESAFLDACTAWNTNHTCNCALASIEDQIGFEQFALATLRTEGNLFNDWRWDRAAFRAVETCSAMARPAEMKD